MTNTNNKPWIAKEFSAIYTDKRNPTFYNVGRAMGMSQPPSDLGVGSRYPKMTYRSDTNGCVYLLYPYSHRHLDVILMVLKADELEMPRLQIAWLLPHGPEWATTVQRWVGDVAEHVNTGKMPKGRLLLYERDGDVS